MTRKVAIRVVCPKCGIERKTMSNYRCNCVKCGKYFIHTKKIMAVEK